MTSIHRKIVYAIFAGIFLISFSLMLFYGKETFYVEKEAASKQVYDYHIALITEEVGNEYWSVIEKGAMKEAVRQNVYLEYVGPRQTDNEEKLETMDRMISAKVDGIIIQGLPGERFKELIRKAVDRDIEVITVDADVPESERKIYVGTDNYKAGMLAGKALIERTEGKQYVGIVTGLFDSVNLQQRVEGFKDAIRDDDRIALIDVKESAITEIGAAQATYSLLKENPQINALFGTSALDGIGMVQGVQEAGGNQRPFIISFDTLPQTISLIEQGSIAATISQYPEEMGRKAVEQMLVLMQRKPYEPIQHTGTGIVTKEEIINGEIIQLPQE